MDNRLRLHVNATRNDSILIGHFNENADDGVWRKVRIDVTPKRIFFAIDDHATEYKFNKTQILQFPHKVVFGGGGEDEVDDVHRQNTPTKTGFTGCIKNVLLGNDLTSIKMVSTG